MRLLAAELGEHGIKVNGVNPDGVVAGSGIFAGGWGAKRAAVYGVEEEDLGKFYAQRTLLKRRCCPSTAPTPSSCSAAPSSPTPPACTSPSTPASPPRSCDDRPAMRFAAVDLGASSGRVIVGEVGPDTPASSTAAAPVPQRRRCARADGLHWDVAALVDHAVAGLADGVRRAGRWPAIGVDSWAVDYGLLRDGRLLGQPFHYRDERRDGDGPRRRRRADRRRRSSTGATGCSTCRSTRSTSSPPTTRPGRGRRDAADPRPGRYWLTGDARHRAHQRLDHRAARRDAPREWDTELMVRLGSRTPTLFADLVDPGDVIGDAAARRRRRGVGAGGVPVVAVGSHDTASAVVGVPMRDATTRRTSPSAPGRWSASSSTQPVLTEEARLGRTSPTRAASTARSASSPT